MAMKNKLIILIAGLVVSIGFNLWFFGFKALQRKVQRDMQRGANIVISQIINEVRRKKEVVISTDNGQLVLVPKEKKAEVK